MRHKNKVFVRKTERELSICSLPSRQIMYKAAEIDRYTDIAEKKDWPRNNIKGLNGIGSFSR